MTKPLRMGSAFSDCLEHWNVTQAAIAYAGFDYKGEDSMYEQRCVEEIAQLYMDTYPQHDREVKIPDVSIGGVNFSGYIDGVDYASDAEIIEDKFKSQWTDTDIEALKLDDQVTGYIAMWHQMSAMPVEDIRMHYRVSRRPALRQKKNESITEFIARMAEDVASRPEWYMNEVTVTRSEKQIKDWLFETEQVGKDMVRAEKSGVWPKNPNACKQYGSLCTMWDICTAKDDEEAALIIDAKKQDAKGSTR